MRVGIIGLGLIGGSIGLALKRANWRQAKIIGYVRSTEVGSIAVNSGVVDKAESNLEDAVKSVDFVVIATPVLTMKDIFAAIGPYLSPGCIVTDTASTKLQVMRWAEEILPSGVNFIGGHPMAGRETSGIKAADVNLFNSCAYCLTPATQAEPTAVQTVVDMVKTLGANPLTIDAQKHDDLVAGISHLPMLLSVALVLATTKNPSWELMSLLAASGYRDLTRLASGNPETSSHICLSNKAAIVSWIDDFIRELQRLRKLVSDDDNVEIEKVLALASEARQKWFQRRYSKE